LKKKTYFYAMEYAADCMNLLGGSESNKMEPGQAPDATLSLNYDLGAQAGAVRLTCDTNGQK
jgi:hypothetical protein